MLTYEVVVTTVLLVVSSGIQGVSKKRNRYIFKQEGHSVERVNKTILKPRLTIIRIGVKS